MRARVFVEVGDLAARPSSRFIWATESLTTPPVSLPSAPRSRPSLRHQDCPHQVRCRGDGHLAVVLLHRPASCRAHARERNTHVSAREHQPEQDRGRGPASADFTRPHIASVDRAEPQHLARHDRPRRGHRDPDVEVSRRDHLVPAPSRCRRLPLRRITRTLPRLPTRSSAGPDSTAPPRDAGYAARPPAKRRTNCSPRSCGSAARSSPPPRPGRRTPHAS